MKHWISRHPILSRLGLLVSVAAALAGMLLFRQRQLAAADVAEQLAQPPASQQLTCSEQTLTAEAG